MTAEDNVFKIMIGIGLLLFLVSSISLFINYTDEGYGQYVIDKVQIEGMQQLKSASEDVKSSLGDTNINTGESYLQAQKTASASSLVNKKNIFERYSDFTIGLLNSLGLDLDSTIIQAITYTFAIFVIISITLLILKIFF